MTCRRARDIDVEAFLIDSAAEGQAQFRTHYPDCADCSAAVAHWSAFDLAVRSMPSPEGVAMGAHPGVERLERLIDSPVPAGTEEIMIRSHVDRCAQCQTEMNVLSRFDPELLAALAVLGIWWSSGFGLVAGAPPQLAAGIDLAENSTLATPTDPPRSGGTGTFGVLAGIEADEALTGIETDDGLPRDAVEQLAEVPRPEASEKGATPGAAARPDPRLLAQTDLEVDSTRDAKATPVERPQSATVDAKAVVAREEILLAALTDLPLPSYGAQPGAASFCISARALAGAPDPASSQRDVRLEEASGAFWAP